MPSRQEVEQALRNAHRAGDIQAARRLAQALKSGQLYGQPQQSKPLPGEVPDPNDPVFQEQMAGAKELVGYKGAQSQQDSIAGSILTPLAPLAEPAFEGMAAVNRGLTKAVDFLSSDQINALSELIGSEFRAPSLTEKTSAATQGGFMPEGLARDAIRQGGELVAPGVAGGQMFRSAAQQLPRFAAQSEGTVAGALRQAGQTTGASEARIAAGSGAGMALGGEAGEEIGGAQGRQIGELLGGLGGGVLSGARPMRGRTTRGEPRRPDTEPELQAREATEATGVDLFPAQQSLDPQQLRAQRFLPELTPATERAAQALSRQNEQASGAVDDFVRSIAPDDAIVTAGGRFRNASQRALEAAKELRAERASPLYQKAIEESVDVNPKPINDVLRGISSRYPESGSVSKVSRRLLNMMNQSETTVMGSSGSLERVASGRRPSLGRMHNVKLEIDDMLNKVGSDALGNTAKRELMKVKRVLLDQMEEASPAYRQARLTFEAESPRVTDLEESIIGKIADIDDTQLKNISRRIFDPAETNPEVVKNAKRVIDEVDPGAWERLVRAEVERRIGSIRPEVGVSFENMPGKLNRAIFGSGKQREALLAGMSDQQRRNAELLERALTRASLGRPGGSETAGRQQFVKELDSGIVSSIRNFLRNPIDSAVGVGESGVFDRRAKALADALFDPAWAEATREAIKDGSENAFGYLLYRVADTIDNEEMQRQRQEEGRPEIPRLPEDGSQTELPAQ